jgi:hypothetical protein
MASPELQSAPTGTSEPQPETPVWKRPWAVALLIGLALFLAAAIPGMSLRKAAINPQDEGLLVVYPARILKGDIPNKSFESVYGAASSEVIAAAFRVRGTSVATERTVGFLYHLVLIGAVATLAWRKRGPRTALFAGALSVFLLAPLDLIAWAFLGALALAAVALLLMDIALEREKSGLLFGAAGLCLGLALSFRTDFALAVALMLVAVAFARPRALWATGAGLIVGLVPLLINVVQAGVGAVIRGQVTEPIFTSGPGRRIPLTSVPFADLLLLACCIGVAVAWARFGIVSLRQRATGSIATTALLIGALEIGILPQAFQRAGQVHALFIACFILPSAILLPKPQKSRITDRGWANVVAIGVLVVGTMAGVASTYGTQVATSLGLHSRPIWSVHHDGRTVNVWSQGAKKNLKGLLTAVDQHSQPGTRVVVGPRDLRRTNYTDTFLYFLLPRLEPGTFYLEMEPGVANADDSRLADDIRKSDLLILTNRYDSWDEPNASKKFGSDVPNAIVKSDFSSVGRWGPWELFARNENATVGS